MNSIAMIAHAATEPELRHTPGGRAVCTVRIAVGRASDGADFFDLTAWERQAEILSQYVSKGQRFGLEGRLQHSTWETDGKRSSKVEIVAKRITLLTSQREQAPAPPPIAA